LSLFVRYLRGIGIYDQLLTFFGSMRKSRKGQPISSEGETPIPITPIPHRR